MLGASVARASDGAFGSWRSSPCRSQSPRKERPAGCARRRPDRSGHRSSLGLTPRGVILCKPGFRGLSRRLGRGADRRSRPPSAVRGCGRRPGHRKWCRGSTRSPDRCRRRPRRRHDGRLRRRSGWRGADESTELRHPWDRPVRPYLSCGAPGAQLRAAVRGEPDLSARRASRADRSCPVGHQRPLLGPVGPRPVARQGECRREHAPARELRGGLSHRRPFHQCDDPGRQRDPVARRPRATGSARCYGVGTSKTRVPQLRCRSGVWLDIGGTYSAAPHTDLPEGSRIAHE